LKTWYCLVDLQAIAKRASADLGGPVHREWSREIGMFPRIHYKENRLAARIEEPFALRPACRAMLCVRPPERASDVNK